MDVELKILDKIQRELKITLDADDMEKYLQNASEHLGQNMKIKGFREGKIPRNVVEGSLGAEKIWQEAMREAVEDFYWKAIKDKDLEPMGMPKIDIVKFIPEQNIEFKAILPVMPEISLPDYKTMAQKTAVKEKKDIEVTEKEIEESLNWLKNSRTQIDEERKKDIEIKIDDEFAKSLGDFENLGALKKGIRERIRKEKIAQEKERLRLLILESIRKKITIKIPEFMIEQELNKMEEEFSQQAAQMGMSMEKYLEQAKKNIKEVRKGWEEKAEERISSGIILRAIAEKEGIEANEKEIEEEANKHLAQFKSSKDVHSHIDPERLKAHISGIIKNEKVFLLLEQENNK